MFLEPASRHSDGPFVYRLGRQVFNLERGVRFPYGLPYTPLKYNDYIYLAEFILNHPHIRPHRPSAL